MIQQKARCCTVDGCESLVLARGFCRRHYTESRRLLAVKKNMICKVVNCPEPIHAKGYCRKHYTQIWRKGEIRHQPSGARLSISRADAEERLRVLDRELIKVQEMYDLVVGFENRTRWRSEITAIQTEMLRISTVLKASRAAAAAT